MQGFFLLFVVVIPSWCGSFCFCFLFVFLGEDRETALGGEKIYTTIFFLFFFMFCFISCFYVVCFFFFRQFSSQVKACFFQGQKNGMGDAMIFCLDFLFSGYDFCLDFLHFAGYHDRVAFPDFLSTKLLIIECAFMLITVSMYWAEQSSASTSKSWKTNK